MSFFAGIASCFPGVQPEKEDDKLDSKQGQQEHLQKEVGDARELLTFAVSEGRRIEDQVIRAINEAESALLDSGPVGTEVRVAFEKAYRDLARLLSPITVGSIRAQPWREKRACRLGVGTCAVLIAFAFYLLAFLTMGGNDRWGPWLPILNYSCLGVLFFLLTFWARYLFTEVVTREIMAQVTLFCYLFTLLCLFSPGLLLLLPSKSDHFNTAMHTAPIGIVFGCLKSFVGQHENEGQGPKELRCDGGGRQWLLTIGGKMLAWRSATDTPLRTQSEFQAVSTGEGVQTLSLHGEVTGGVAVPLYILVFALWGGAVNMLRRVPEYQWRGMDVKDSLTKEQARECLIFQMTQVLAAPLVAIATYYVLEPSSQKSSIALSFASGLASHPILLAIRAVTDTLTPAKLEVSPADSKPNPAGTREEASVTKEKPKSGE